MVLRRYDRVMVVCGQNVGLVTRVESEGRSGRVYLSALVKSLVRKGRTLTAYGSVHRSNLRLVDVADRTHRRPSIVVFRGNRLRYLGEDMVDGDRWRLVSIFRRGLARRREPEAGKGE